MPIFEYECASCHTSFDLLVRSDTRVACPRCESQKVVKKLSLFAAHVARPAHAVPECHTGHCGCDLGRCGSGMCGVE
ncbi:MAG TPA: FmdB family zinc ribbon protein [Spirochaetia bacterium]|nr:FmdB family zinc ribbon protein [Spirochaetia bacterium]